MALRFGTAERLRPEKTDNPVPENEVKRFAAKKMPGDLRQMLFTLRRKMRLRATRSQRISKNSEEYPKACRLARYETNSDASVDFNSRQRKWGDKGFLGGLTTEC